MNFNRLHEEETERLALLSSSLGKVTQAVSDVILHGYEDQPRDSEATYRTLLEKVIGDLNVSLRLMYGAGDIERSNVAMHEDARCDSVMLDLHHQEGVRRFEFVPRLASDRKE